MTIIFILTAMKYVARFITSSLSLQKCLISSNEAAVALRPFYFAVHPDRFARQPHLQTRNEKALQTFNGYLNNLFPRPGIVQSPVQIEFTIKDRENNLKDIRLLLYGADAEHIVRTALDKCELSTEHLPKSFAQRKTSNTATGTRPEDSFTEEASSKQWTAKGLEETWQNLQQHERMRRKQFSRKDFFNGIFKNRPLAMQRMENHRRMEEFIKDEIEDIERRTGVTQILWSINWELSFMRRCLLNVQAMISHAEIDCRDTIIHALNGRKLNFGRGSYVCCDGSLQFGADDATGAWQKVCLESTVRRFDVQNLELLVARVVDLLGGIHLIVRPFGNLLHTIQYMQIFIGRICSQPESERVELKSLLQRDQPVEIVNHYCELMMMVDGCIQVPCNVEFHSLKQFLVRNSGAKAGQMKRDQFAQKCLLDKAKNESEKHLGLAALSWDADLSFTTILDSLRKLREIDPDRVSNLSNLEIHVSSSQKLMVLSSGKISVPVGWIKVL